MKILLSTQIREADSYTIENEPIASIDLMERASVAFVNWFIENFGTSALVKVFCGSGNNGGDGLAIARLLIERGYRVDAYIVRTKSGGSADFITNYERLKNITTVQEITASEDLPAIAPEEIVIDALFGSGLSRPVEGLFAKAIRSINQAKATVVAVDIASGLFSDAASEGEAIVKADYTISFQVPKLAFFMRQNFEYVGEWKTVDIGLDNAFIETLPTDYYTIEKDWVKTLIPVRNKFSHKGNFGRVMIIAGSHGKMGAAVLCGRACLKTGAGLLTIHSPACGYQIVQIAVPEAMATVDPSIGCFSEVPDLDPFDTVGLGPGLGTNEKTIAAYQNLLENAKFPLVIDADGINMLAKEPELLKLTPEDSILTPHPKEFERIAGGWDNDFDKLALQRNFAMKHKLYIVLKGAHTTVATPDGRIYFNTTGNPGMASAGSGDVLTGMVTALLGQTKDPLKAAVAGVYLHGLAGDLAAEMVGQESMIASDIIDHIGPAFKLLRHS